MRNKAFVAAAAVGALLLSGCAATTTKKESTAALDVFGTYATMAAADRDPKLVDLAKKEGALTVYSGYSSLNKLTDAFSKKYGIPVKAYSADNETMEQKFEQEEKAGRAGADVVDSGYVQVTQIDKDGYFLQGWKPNATLGTVPATPSAGWSLTRYIAIVTAWNSDKVTGTQQPNTVNDLTDPAWKGKMAVEVSDQLWYGTLKDYFESQGMTAAAVTDLFTKIMANSRVVKGHTAIGDLMTAGDVLLSPDLYAQTVAESQSKKGPISYVRSDGQAYQIPIVMVPSGQGIAKNAPHPAAALLYADFIDSQDGQQLLKDNGATPWVPSMQGLPQGATLVTVPITKLLADTTYTDEWNKLLKTASK